MHGPEMEMPQAPQLHVDEHSDKRTEKKPRNLTPGDFEILEKIKAERHQTLAGQRKKMQSDMIMPNGVAARSKYDLDRKLERAGFIHQLKKHVYVPTKLEKQLMHAIMDTEKIEPEWIPWPYEDITFKIGEKETELTIRYYSDGSYIYLDNN